MAGKTMIFNPNEALRYFMKEDFDQIPVNKLHNIIINIFPYELDILKNWEDHFQSVSIPYAIVETRKLIHGHKPVMVFEMWAEKVVDRNHHKLKDKKTPMPIKT